MLQAVLRMKILLSAPAPHVRRAANVSFGSGSSSGFSQTFSFPNPGSASKNLSILTQIIFPNLSEI
jgi:hypothetical protein